MVASGQRSGRASDLALRLRLVEASQRGRATPMSDLWRHTLEVSGTCQTDGSKDQAPLAQAPSNPQGVVDPLARATALTDLIDSSRAVAEHLTELIREE